MITIKRRFVKFTSTERRAAFIMFLMFMLMGGLCVRILSLSVNDNYVEAAARQSLYTVTINET
ncbi:MAG: hypothetical protein FWE86_00280, partial [Oscillospiraceae bacterium]|nr:hypothetical protein [Oscillospiraceae bacterium]